MKPLVRRDDHSVPIRGGLEPRARRLAPVAWAEAGRHLCRTRPVEGLAGGRTTGRLARDRRRRRLLVVLSGARPALYARRARRDRIRDGVRRRHRKKDVGGRARPAIQQRQGDGPRATPTVDGDRLYTFGASGDMSVLDAATGKVFWKVNVLEKFGGSNIQWGLSESPLVLSDRMLVSPGGRGASIVALKKADGSLLWKSLERRAGIFVRGAARGRRHSRRRFTSRPSGRSASTCRPGSCSGATTRSRTGLRTSRRRSTEETVSFSRPRTAPVPPCWS